MQPIPSQPCQITIVKGPCNQIGFKGEVGTYLTARHVGQQVVRIAPFHKIGSAPDWSFIPSLHCLKKKEVLSLNALTICEVHDTHIKALQ